MENAWAPNLVETLKIVYPQPEIFNFRTTDAKNTQILENKT